jgi:glycosyltransferase involved in cell wall biosynthesis
MQGAQQGMKPPRFAVVTNIPTPYRTAFFDELARVCDSRGFAFKVFYCARTEGDRAWQFDPAKMAHAFEVLPGFHLRRGEATFHLNPSVLGRLGVYRPDVVLSAGSWHMLATFLTSLRMTGRYRSVFWSEGHADTVRHRSGPISRLRRLALGLHDAFAVPNRRSAEWIRAEAGEDSRIITLPNTVEGAFFTRENGDERQEARRELGLSADEKVLVQVSQLSARKGVIPLAEAFLRLPDHLRQVARLVFVGSGLEEAELRKMADASGGRVVVAGSVPAEGVHRWLMAANWFVLNTWLDPNPLAPIEASFAALPLLMTHRAGNFEELLREGHTGFGIADPADPTPALRLALETPPERAALMGEEARANARENFDIHRVATNLVDDLVALADASAAQAG